MITNLKIIREEKGRTQSQLARAAGISKRTLQEYEQGRKLINKAQIGTVMALADALECDIKDILE